MKVALLGDHPLAIEMASMLLNLEAQVALFSDSDWTGPENLAPYHKKVQLLRVQKRHLGMEDEIPGKSRFLDLFRLVYSPHLEIEPTLSEKFEPKVIESLQVPIEVYEDFDVVIDSRRELWRPRLMGPSGGPALGERGLALSGKILYLDQGLDSLSEILMSEPQSLLIQGDSELAARAIVLLRSWLEEGDHRLILVNKKARPFVDRPLVQELLAHFDLQYQHALALYEREKVEWEALEDYIQAKTPSPLGPVPRVQNFTYCNILSVDQMLDHPELFVTLEPIDFGEEDQRPRTLKVNKALVSNGVTYPLESFPGLRLEGTRPVHPEPGFYSLFSPEHVSQIMENLLSLFTKTT